MKRIFTVIPYVFPIYLIIRLLEKAVVGHDSTAATGAAVMTSLLVLGALCNWKKEWLVIRKRKTVR